MEKKKEELCPKCSGRCFLLEDGKLCQCWRCRGMGTVPSESIKFK